MTNLPHSQPVVTIYLGATPAEVALIDDMRRCPDRSPELVTAAEQELLRAVRVGSAEFAAHTARTLADEALGLRDKVTR